LAYTELTQLSAYEHDLTSSILAHGHNKVCMELDTGHSLVSAVESAVMLFLN